MAAGSLTAPRGVAGARGLDRDGEEQWRQRRKMLPRSSRSSDGVVRPRPRQSAISFRSDVPFKWVELGNDDDARTVADWLFICIGGEPQSDWAEEVGVMRDEGGYIKTGPDLWCGVQRPANWPLDRNPYNLQTNFPGLFAAGDVRHGSVKRCASAVGEGAMAVAFVHRYLANG
ncbi:MAG TPA: FAD-dependent oxidoreductase [Gammaproteobacteria bacterium]|nr:FAD-dependent oxidoreductase [Gammaproteobacteria bacterium]